MINYRQVPEGYHVAGMPAVEDIPRLTLRGVTMILSLAALDVPTAAAARAAQMETRQVLTSTMAWEPVLARVALSSVVDVPPARILLHCHRGRERSGAMLAYFLWRLHGYSAQAAVAAVRAGGTHTHKGRGISPVYQRLIRGLEADLAAGGLNEHA